MLYLRDKCTFSASVALRSKAQCAVNGKSLGKHWNTAAWRNGDALRVRLSTPTDCVTPLDKGPTIACEACLAVNVDNLTEFTLIT